MPVQRTAKRSHGLLMYRFAAHGGLEVFLAHPGGPYFARKDAGAWTIPKGVPNEGEEPLTCARREFEEETGMPAGEGPFWPLGEIRQRAGKAVHAWAFRGDFAGRVLQSNAFEIEWPPHSGERRSFPEVDRVEFFSIETARVKLNPGQVPLLDRLLYALELAKRGAVEEPSG